MSVSIAWHAGEAEISAPEVSAPLLRSVAPNDKQTRERMAPGEIEADVSGAREKAEESVGK